jgi:hypothetical protein
MDDELKKIDKQYKEFMEKEKRRFRKGIRNSKHAECEGNLW